ncbi:DUF7674 family protein [Paenibacillus typhae]|uniref:DUF7674 domain-containing protein n=1 Tax=Paenibacillus typhae TaxID=1174501 RepID=A0A1G9DZE2_9BACL|nr:resolvase [Paenibacillus typhae]SDK69226.1 hypothetical protein SAMN05216192_15039 [Paenibacillus typhae]
MNEKSEEFMRKMLELLPSTEATYRESITLHDEVLETVIIEDIFMPEIIKLLKEERNINLLEIIFEFFEGISNDEDAHLINVFSVTVLEILGNDKLILETARKYMGTKTYQLQIEADKALGRI